jgi:GTP-binding protein LepA
MVFCGIYPTDSFNFNDLFDAISKIKLNDSSLVYEIESSPVLGKGIRCGFLGLLHIEIIKERLEREYNLKLLLTLPSVDYQVQLKKNQEILIIDNPIKMPE